MRWLGKSSERFPKSTQIRGKSLERNLLKYWESSEMGKMATIVVGEFDLEGIMQQLNETGKNVVVLKPEGTVKSVEYSIKSLIFLIRLRTKLGDEFKVEKLTLSPPLSLADEPLSLYQSTANKQITKDLSTSLLAILGEVKLANF
jgi:hypothetical protein